MSRPAAPRSNARARGCLAAALSLWPALGPAVLAGPLPPAAHATHYVADGERVLLLAVPDRLCLEPAAGFDAEALAGAARMSPFCSGATVLPVGLVDVRIEPLELRGEIQRWRLDPRVAAAEPVYSYGGRLLYAGSGLAVGLFSGAAAADLAPAHRLTGARERAALEEFPDVVALRLPAAREFDLLDAVALYQQQPGVAFAEPRLYGQAAAGAPNDPLFPQQWALANTGQNGGTPGADIDALGAWGSTTGDPGIVIAIIDEGVDLDHPDLAPNLIAGIDTTDQALAMGWPGNANFGDGHGTACAGIAAAAHDNGVGVSGVAPRCKIMPVRVGYSAVWTTNEWPAQGIQRAWQMGADVLSNSWGGMAPSNLITSAVHQAVTKGRGGRGSVVLFATGNSDAPEVSYPALLPDAIAVGASSPCDERKSPSSCDGQWWGSNYGTALDIVAPGVAMPTTDASGTCGYSPSGDLAKFNGTSAACPAAAGVAALVLSVRPCLTAQEVRDVLEGTADDLLAPGKDLETGFGRVNAYGAVQVALGSYADCACLPVVEPPLTPPVAAAGDQVGSSVAICGTRILAGAPGDGAGAAYGWEPALSTEQYVKLTAADGAANDGFGTAVALAGGTAVIGSPYDDDGGASSGSAYVFGWNGFAAAQQAKLTAPDAAAGDEFGSAVALEGSFAAIGAPGDDDQGANSGAVYVFVRSSGSWTLAAKLLAADGGGGKRLGNAVAISGERIVAGATAANSAYVFERSGDSWVQAAKLTSSDNAWLFGKAVAISGARAVVGANWDNDLGADSGSAFVFECLAGTWTHTAKLLAPDGGPSQTFGVSVAVSGDRILVGADHTGDLGTLSGSVYAFELAAGAWASVAKLTAPGGSAWHRFGYAVALSGDQGVAGMSDYLLGTLTGSASPISLVHCPPLPPAPPIPVNPGPPAKVGSSKSY